MTLCAQERVAIDTEFHRERTYFPQTGLIQIAWSDGLALVDPLPLDLQGFSSLLDSEVIIVMHAAGQDLEVFDRLCATMPRHLFDTQVAAGFIGMSTPSLSALHERELGIELAKGDRLTDWLARPLSDSQCNYAVADVLYLLEIYDRLIAQLTELGRLTWAQDECDLLLERERGRRNPDDSWKRIKEARHLKGSARNNARSLAAWRESEAARQDVPVRRLLPDLAVVSIAQQAPKNIDALRKIRGVDGRHTKAAMAEGILRALEDAANLPPLPKPDRRKKEDSRDLRAGVTLVSAWVSQAARQFDLDPTLLGTRADIEALVRGEDDARMRTGWRHEIIGGPVADLLAGKAALSFDKDGGLLLEERKG